MNPKDISKGNFVRQQMAKRRYYKRIKIPPLEKIQGISCYEVNDIDRFSNQLATLYRNQERIYEVLMIILRGRK